MAAPVIYIDGVRISTAGLGNFDPSGQGLAGNSGGQGANAFDLVNPGDIESIEIIKGPAAATLYGADAANGAGKGRGAAREPLAVLGAHPESGKELKVMEGRFGPYVTDGETHATLPKSADPKAVTLEEAVRLIDERAAKGPAKKKGGRKPARKKAK